MRFGKKTNGAVPVRQYDHNNFKPIIKCSICTGEQVAGFKDIHTGRFEEVMLIKNSRDLDAFMQLYGVKDVSKEY